MKNQSAKWLFSILLILFLSACGVFEVGLERTPTQPAAIATTFIPPTDLPPTATVPPPTPTPFPGQLKPGQAVRIVQIRMLDKANGWAIGQVESDLNDHILFTLDGGLVWQDRTPPEAFLKMPENGGLAATAHFGADGSAWVAYAASSPAQPMPVQQILWHTSDNGLTWQIGSRLDLTGFQAEYFVPSTLGFLDDQVGWLLAHTGAGMSHDYIVAFTTSDGGESWNRAIDAEKAPELMGCAKTGLAFSSTVNGLLTGNCPGLMTYLFFYTTADGGQTWQLGTLYPPANQPIDLFSGTKAGCGVPNLLYLTARSTLLTLRCDFYNSQQSLAWLYSSKDGRSLEPHPLPQPFGALQFIDADEGWFIGSAKDDPAAPGEIYYTLDGGLTWKKIIATSWQGQPDFVDGNTGWVVARTAEKTALVFTSNGGLLWEQLNPVIGK